MAAVHLTAAGYQLAQGTAECLGTSCTATPVRMKTLLPCTLLEPQAVPRLLLGTEAPIITPNSMEFSFPSAWPLLGCLDDTCCVLGFCDKASEAFRQLRASKLFVTCWHA